MHQKNGKMVLKDLESQSRKRQQWNYSLKKGGNTDITTCRHEIQIP